MIERRSFLTGSASLLAATASCVTARADQYPDKAVRMIVPFAPGGPTDVTARIIANGLSERFGKQFYIENIGGAGGNTGTVQAARARPDGYTLVVISTGFMVNPSLYVHVPYDAKKDFVPITLACASPNILTINADVPAKNLKELVALIRATPGKFSFGFPGAGSTPHLSGELFRLHFNLDLVGVPFTGAAPVITSTLGGHTPLAWTALPPALEGVKAGKLRAMAVTSAQRVASLPDVPTMAEAGVPKQEAETLTALMAPAGTPAAIVDQLNKEIVALVHKPEIKKQFADLGFESFGTTQQEFAKRIDEELVKWARVIKDAKIPQIH